MCPHPPQVRDNEQLSRLCQELEARLAELEREAERGATDAEDRRRMLEDVQSDKATLSRALTQNRELKGQLAELQNGFVKLVRAAACSGGPVWGPRLGSKSGDAVTLNDVLRIKVPLPYPPPPTPGEASFEVLSQSISPKTQACIPAV